MPDIWGATLQGMLERPVFGHHIRDEAGYGSGGTEGSRGDDSLGGKGSAGDEIHWSLRMRVKVCYSRQLPRPCSVGSPRSSEEGVL